MQTSLYLGRLIGPVLLLVGASILIDPAGYLAMAGELLKTPAVLYVAALLGLLGGVALVLAHNVWVLDWRLILTLLGWISIFDSASWLLVPKPMARFWSPLLDKQGFAIGTGIVTVLLGAVLCYFGYFAREHGRPA